MPFAGWEMPVQYAGIKEEHLAVRSHAGIFDVTHMGEIETTGPDAQAFLQRILSNDVSKIAERGAQYSVLCKEDGGVLDDLFTYKLGEDHYLTVTNAANHEKDLAWFTKQARRVRRRRSTTPCTTTRCSRSRAPRRAASSRSSPTASCPSASAPPRSPWRASRTCSCAAPATPARTAWSC